MKITWFSCTLLNYMSMYICIHTCDVYVSGYECFYLCLSVCAPQIDPFELQLIRLGALLLFSSLQWLKLKIQSVSSHWSGWNLNHTHTRKIFSTVQCLAQRILYLSILFQYSLSFSIVCHKMVRRSENT